MFAWIGFVPDCGLIRTWIGGLSMAIFSSILFGFSMYMGLPPRRYE